MVFILHQLLKLYKIIIFNWNSIVLYKLILCLLLTLLSFTNCNVRALNFIAIMLEELVKTEDEISACASRAYDQTLRNYHGFIVRGVFSVSRISYY